MYLRRLELQGFKTFAQKTVLEFEPDSDGRRGLTGIVGPNGSGKSNVADAARWVMGEQSLKLLRSKKSEDVIFSGTDKKPRAGFAEVNMTIVNDDKPDLDFSEIVITRRLYRDGQSEYEINKQSVRLTDVTMLLAQCGIGQRTYSVIGQGMVDDILSASPAERKEFFDEAAGLKPFQLKRQSSENKLEATKENLRQSDAVLKEIGPRLHSLERQVKRLEQRDALDEELKNLEAQYYGGTWKQLKDLLASAKQKHEKMAQEVAKASSASEALETELNKMESANPPSDEFRKIRENIDALAVQRDKLREKQMRLEASREVAKIRAEKPWTPLPLSKIIESIEDVRVKQEDLLKLLESGKVDAGKLKQIVEDLNRKVTDLVAKLQRPAPEPESQASDPSLEKEISAIANEMLGLNEKIRAAQSGLEEWNKREQGQRTHIFEIQRQLSTRRQELQSAERRLSEVAVELARAETKRDGFLEEARAHIENADSRLDQLATAATSNEPLEGILPKITKLRTQLEWIGGIDPEVMKEYEETKKRFDDLNTQVEDLVKAMVSLETIIKELDLTITERSKTSFRRMNFEFGNYFKKIFGGGDAKLIEVFEEPEVNELGEVIKAVDPNAGPSGVDIQATPPGKRLKAISLLSGGERALVSIALICAIMATNPSPFVVLDEVDAALDESNSAKFAEIISTLADKTQFVIITHNRATMGRAHILYGVTMGNDGVSQLLSVKLQNLK